MSTSAYLYAHSAKIPYLRLDAAAVTKKLFFHSIKFWLRCQQGSVSLTWNIGSGPKKLIFSTAWSSSPSRVSILVSATFTNARLKSPPTAPPSHPCCGWLGGAIGGLFNRAFVNVAETRMLTLDGLDDQAVEKISFFGTTAASSINYGIFAEWGTGMPH